MTQGRKVSLVSEQPQKEVGMIGALQSVLKRIADGTLLPPTYYQELNCDAALDARDGDGEFVDEWTRLDRTVRSLWPTASVPPEQGKLAEEIRKEAFLVVSRATSQHEIASYVSDDIALIIRSRLLGLSDPLLDKLWRVYEKGEFPRPPV